MLYISFVGYEKRVYVYLMMIGETLVYLWRKLAKYVAKVEILAKEKVEIYVLEDEQTQDYVYSQDVLWYVE
jgi:hypothetical protein